VGVVAAVVVDSRGPLGMGALLGAPVLAVCVLLGVVVEELVAARAPHDRVREASLEVRRVRDYLPRALTVAVAGTGVALVVLLVVTTLMGSDDDLGRPGRALVRACSATMTASHGPWPGSFYSVPLALVLLLGAVTATAALRALVLRRRAATDPAGVVADDTARRRAATTVMGALGLVFALPLAGVAITSAAALHGIDCRPVAWTVGSWVVGLLVPGALAIAAWSAAAVMSPGRVSGRESVA